MRKIICYITALVLTFSVLSFQSIKPQAAAQSVYAGKVVTSSGRLNIRKSAGTSSAVIKSVKNKSNITLLSKSGNWWKVEYAKGKTGYCHKDYIEKNSASYPRYVNVSSGNLNVRKGAGTSYDIKAKLARGTRVVVLSQKNSYSRILYHGTKTGYVKTAYLSKTAPKSSFPKVSLDVVSYKQNDARWKNIKIGTQGDTIGSSGCTTTALAMIKSYKTGKTLTPKTMASQLSYANAGWLYWPSDCSVSEASENYLSQIYAHLKAGRPVAFGCKKASGSQHWVVVTGYDGNAEKLEKSGFIINDPGSNTRTRLSQFMSAYPNPYKTAVYL